MTNDAAPTPTPSRALHRVAALALRVLLVAVVLAALWVLGSASGLRVALHAFLPALEFRAVEGSLIQGVTLRDLRFATPRFTLRAASLSAAGRASWRGGLVLHELRAERLEVQLPTPTTHATGGALRVPFPLRIDAVQVLGLAVVKDGQRHDFESLSAAVEATPFRWALRDFALRGAAQRLSGHASYADGRLAGAFKGQLRVGDAETRAVLNLDGELAALGVELEVQAPLIATLRGELDARAVPPRFKGELAASLPVLGALSGELDGDAEHARLQLTAPLTHAAPALRDGHIKLDVRRRDGGVGAALEWRIGATTVLHGQGDVVWQGDGVRLALDSSAPAASLRARLLFDSRGPRLGARIRWRDVALPIDAEAHSSGALKLRGGLDGLFVTGALRVDDAQFGASRATLRGRWQGQTFELAQLDAQLLGGNARVHGSFDGQAQLCTRLVFEFRRLDFSHLDAALGSRLEGLGRAHGCRVAAGWQGGVTLEQLAGRWRAQPLRARGELEHDAQRSVLRKLHAEVAGNTLDADLELSDVLAGQFRLEAPHLAVVWPSLAGSISADGRVSGTRKAPALRGHVDGRDLMLDEWRAARLRADVDVDVDGGRTAASSVTLELTDLMRGSEALGTLRGEGQGTPRDHALSLSLRGKTLNADVRARGAWQTPRWTGSVTRLRVTETRLGDWRLDALAPLAWQAGEISLGPACLAQADARLCVTLPRWHAARGVAALELTGVPVALARAWLPATLVPYGRVTAAATLQRADGAWHGDGQASIADGGVRHAGPGGAHEDLPLRDARADFSLDGERLRATFGFALGQWLNAKGSLNAGLAAHTPVEGRLTLDMPDVRWLEEFWPELAGSSGAARLEADVRGAPEAPRLDATLRTTHGSLWLPRFGTQLTELSLDADGVLGAPLALSGAARLGDGRLDVAGQFDARHAAGPRAVLELKGDGLALVRLPDIEADAAPRLTLTIAPGLLGLDGQVTWSRVQIHMPTLPERAVATSSDVVLVNGAEEAAAPAPRPRWFVDTLDADLDLTLGDEVALTAAGLNAKLNGAVHWRKPRGDERGRGRGGLNIVNGHYKAYGQDLKIQRGALIFDGVIDNPSLEVRAIRADLEEVVAGVRVTGSLRMPKFALFAEPSLPDAEVLSYLVTGHALANASSGEAGVIARAALSLGADRAALVTSQLSNLFALDEFGINPGTTARTSSIVAGKRLTPKLTVRSEFNPFERLWSFFLNYKLTPRWSVEAQTGAGQGADVIYSVERDTLRGNEPLTPVPAPRPSLP